MKKLFLFAAVLFAANLSQAQWEPDVRLTTALYGSYTSYNNAWCIAVSGDSVHIAWYDERDGGYPEIYYKCSTDAGVSWGADTRLTNNTAHSWCPSIIVSGLVVHVVWFEDRTGYYEIYYKRSTDGGISWGADTRLTYASVDAEYPSLAISGSVLHLVWWDYRDNANGDYEIYYKRSIDGGTSWESDTRLTYDGGYSGMPSVAVSVSVVHVLWEDDRDGNGEIYYKRSADGGISWGADTRITNNSADSWGPSVAVDGSVVHVTWMDKRNGGEYEVYYKRSSDGGLTWGEDTRLTYAAGDSQYPNIAVSGSLVHIVWYDKRDGNDEIYYKQSTDGGINWGEDLRLTNAIFTSQQPSVAVSDSIIHVVWNDDREMNNEIYYKRNPTGNILVGIENELSGDSEQQINIYPNPASRKLTVVSRQSSVRLSIMDLYGREIKEFANISSFPYQVDISNLSDGVYLLRIESEEGESGSAKFLKIDE